MTTIKLIGAYRVSVSPEERHFITAEVTGDAAKTEEELSRLALLEIEVRGARDDFDVGSFHQPDSDQVAYDEQYFSVDGLRPRGQVRPAVADFRVCFFLHHFEISEGITSPYGELKSLALAEMPQRLARVCVYKHPG